jgi:hypothetical protein
MEDDVDGGAGWVPAKKFSPVWCIVWLLSGEGKAMAEARLEITYEVGVRFDATLKTHLAYAPALQLYAQGDSEEAAVHALTANALLYFHTIGKNSYGDLIGALQHHEIPIYRDGDDVPKTRENYARMLEARGFHAVTSKLVLA